MAQSMMQISHVDPKSISRQTIINGNLVTEFQESDLHGAGTLVCEPCTLPEREAWYLRYGDEFGGLESETVTRFKRLFWDFGTFT